MKKSAATILSVIALIAFAGSCAKDVVETDSEAAARAFSSWVKVHFPSAIADGYAGNGIYIIYDKPGTGDTVKDSAYIFNLFEQRKMADSSIVAYTRDSLAKQLGTYTRSGYYGPDVIHFISGLCQKGVMDLLNGNDKYGKMKVGGTRTAVIPADLTNSGVNCIYKLTVTGQTGDITQWQIDNIEKYMSDRSIAIEDTTGHRGIYYWRDRDREKSRGVTVPETAMPKDTTVYIYYIGRHLNGQIFDTNVKDSAKVHGIYSESNAYKPVSITWSADSTALKMSGSSIISGFSRTLWKMHPYESGRGFFVSDYGYGKSGNGTTIGAYEPLIFEIDIVENK